MNHFWSLGQQQWLVSNFSLQYQPWIKYTGYKNKGIDQQWKIIKSPQCKIIKSPHSTMGNIVKRIWIQMLECNSFENLSVTLQYSSETKFCYENPECSQQFVLYL